MLRFKLPLVLAASLIAMPAAAQGWVQGQRPADPRLRSQPVQPGPAQSAQVAAAPAQQAAPITGGPLQRPSYLQPAETPQVSSGPSALDLMTQCFDGSISGRVVNPTCVGYLAGFIGALRISEQTAQGYPICLPEVGIANEDIVAEISGYLEQNPDALQKSARSVAFMVLAQKFPCQRQ